MASDIGRAEERAVEAAAEECYERWTAGEHLSTLDLRAAQHAADRAGDRVAAAKLALEIDDREAVEGAS